MGAIPGPLSGRCGGRASYAYATDALQVHRLAACAGLPPALFAPAPPLAAMELAGTDLADLFDGERREEEYVDGILILCSGGGLTLRGKIDLHRMDGWCVPLDGHSRPCQHQPLPNICLGLSRSHGQRIFVEMGGTRHLLDAPSAYEMASRRLLSALQARRWFDLPWMNCARGWAGILRLATAV